MKSFDSERRKLESRIEKLTKQIAVLEKAVEDNRSVLKMMMMMMMTMWSISGSKRWEVRKRTKVFVAVNLFRSTLSLWIGQHTRIQKQKCKNTKVCVAFILFR